MMVNLSAAAAAILPADYTARPVRLDDIEALVAMLNAAARAEVGADQHTVEGWRSELQIPGYDLERDTRLVLAPDGGVAAFASLWNAAPYVNPELWASVHPDHVRRGLGTYLAAWAEARARETMAQAPEGARVVLVGWVNALAQGTQALLLRQGFHLARHNLRMVIEFDAPPPEPEWPAGVRVRTFVPGQDERATRLVIHEAFRDHWGYVERPFEENLARWTYATQSDPLFDPSLWFLALADGPDGQPAVIGTSLARLHITDDPEMGWINSLGVLRPWRRQGVALALLRHSFCELYRRGQRKVGLGVDADSLTGATRLYEKAGMRPHPRFQYGIWEKELRPGRDVTTSRL